MTDTQRILEENQPPPYPKNLPEGYTWDPDRKAWVRPRNKPWDKYR